MSNLDKYFTPENSHKVFLCHINNDGDSKVIELQCYYDNTSCIVEAYNFEEAQDDENYIDKIIDVIEEVVHGYDEAIQDVIDVLRKEGVDSTVILAVKELTI